LDGKFDVIPYDDIVILCKNNRKYLIPNIYINPKLLGIGETIRGDIIIVCKDNKNFKSLTKEQCIKYMKFLRRASFNYNNKSNTSRFSLYEKKIFKWKNSRKRFKFIKLWFIQMLYKWWCTSNDFIYSNNNTKIY